MSAPINTHSFVFHIFETFFPNLAKLIANYGVDFQVIEDALNTSSTDYQTLAAGGSVAVNLTVGTINGKTVVVTGTIHTA